MSHDLPDIPELLRTVIEFLERITARLDGEERYHALCSKFLLEIVLRELNEWEPRITDDDRRLMALLGDRECDVADLSATLSAAIRAGDFDNDMPGLLEFLIQHVESKVRVTNPGYLLDE